MKYRVPNKVASHINAWLAQCHNKITYLMYMYELKRFFPNNFAHPVTRARKEVDAIDRRLLA